MVGGFFVELSKDSSGEKSQVATTREPRLSASNRISRDASAGGSDESDRVSRRRDRQVEQAIGVAREQGNNSLTPTIRGTQGSSVCFRCFCCPSCAQVFRLLVRVSCLCRLSSRIADIFQTHRDAPIQCAQPASAVWSPVKGFALHLGGYGLHAPVCDQESFVEKNPADVRTMWKMPHSQALPAMAPLSLSKFAVDVAPILYTDFPPVCACFLPLLVVFTNCTLVSCFTTTPQTFVNARCPDTVLGPCAGL